VFHQHADAERFALHSSPVARFGLFSSLQRLYAVTGAVSYLMLGRRHSSGRPRAGSFPIMYPACSSCTAAEGASGCFLVLWFCSDRTQIVLTRPANSNCLLVTQYMLFESVRFFGLAVFPSLCSFECGSAHDCSPHWIDALHIRRLASGESIFMGNVVQTVVTNTANNNCTLVTRCFALYVLFELVRVFGVGCFSSPCIWSQKKKRGYRVCSIIIIRVCSSGYAATDTS
jgi:hypothetical protein